MTASGHPPFAAIPLSRTHLDALFVLAHSSVEVTAGSLASALRVTPGAVTAIIGRLHHSGLLEVASRPSDARVRVLRLTPVARTQVSIYETRVVESLIPRFGALTDEQLTTLARLIADVDTTS